MNRLNPIWGMDASKWQGKVNWQQVAAEGFKFAIVKATEGLYYKDPYLARNLEWSEKRGLIPGAYHFLTNEGTKAQIDKFLAAVGNPEGKLIALDCEDPRWYGVKGRGQPTVTDVWNAVHYLHEKIGPHPILLYSGNWWWSGVLGNPDATSLVRDKGCHLWVSRYVTGSGFASVLYKRVPAGWWDGKDGGGFGGQKPTILQFSESAKIAGQQMDANAFAGSVAELKALTVSKKAAAKDHYVTISGVTKAQAEAIATNHKERGREVEVGK